MQIRCIFHLFLFFVCLVSMHSINKLYQTRKRNRFTSCIKLSRKVCIIPTHCRSFILKNIPGIFSEFCWFLDFEWNDSKLYAYKKRSLYIHFRFGFVLLLLSSVYFVFIFFLSKGWHEMIIFVCFFLNVYVCEHEPASLIFFSFHNLWHW